MRAWESMKKKLRPLGIYDLSDGTNISAELKAYAEALDRHRDNLDEALRECFIGTAEDYGLSERERIFTSPRTSRTAAGRRDLLRERFVLGERDFTPEGFEKFLRSFGANTFSYSELPSAQSFTVVLGGDYPQAEEEWIKNQIRLVIPAHLDGYVYSGGQIFGVIDLRDLTFAEIDAQDYSWDQLNNL